MKLVGKWQQGKQEQLKNNKMELLNNIRRVKGLISEQLPPQQSSSNLPPQQSNANSGGGSSTPRTRGTILNPQDYEGINFKYKYPGDRNYIYGVKGNDWYAKNITNNRVFNISKDGFTSSVDKLKAQFPNAFKEVVQPINPETKTPETPTQDSTKVVTNVPPIKPVDSANTGTPVKPVDSVNTITPIKPVDSTTDEPDDLTNY
jgi:hypothetical protein